MSGTRLNALTLAATLAIACGSARAADYPQPIPQPQPPPIVYQQPVVEEFSSGWYLRGDIGIGMVGAYKLDYLPSPVNVDSGFAFQHSSSADTFFIGAGVGYEWNNWLRFDVTGEYRAKSRVYAIGTYPNALGTLDVYEGDLKSWIFLANAYVDLGTWNCFTPFVGVGIGAAHNTLADFSDTSPTNGYGFGRNPSEWHPAWALHAGVAYNVTKNFKVELAYRYLNYGSITDTVDCSVGCSQDSFKFSKLYSNDIKIGFRWTCCETDTRERFVYTQQTYAPPPVYTPPPVYQPPLRSKG